MDVYQNYKKIVEVLGISKMAMLPKYIIMVNENLVTNGHFYETVNHKE